jgi:hypothetical protein
MLLTQQIAAVFVEHKDGHRVAVKIREELAQIDDDRLALALFRGAQLMERAKEYKDEVGYIRVIVHEFAKLISFIFPVDEYHALVVATTPNIAEFRPFITDVREIIKKNIS